jgi:hypothetical protein
MAAHILLLGAGFSANWGGPLAQDFFNWLLQRPEIAADNRLKKLLWDHRTAGGFENALSQVQTDYLLSPSADSKARLDAFQNAVNGSFAEMDVGFARRATWDFNNEIGRLLVDFLIGFDAIFTLNQDLLFERFYMNDNVTLASRQRWNGCIIPGMHTLPNATIPFDVGQMTRVPDPDNFKVLERFQPYFKLHGSYRWQDGTGNRLMVMGGSKSVAIQSNKVLQWYFSEFRRHLSLGATRLMVIGYGFGDPHINEAIASAEPNGLRMFIVDPLGVDVANPTRALPLRMPNPFQNVIESASQIPVNRIFGDNVVEHARLMKFFQ